MDLNLRDKVAVITGCSAGIGRQIAKALAAEWVKTAIVARRGDRLEALQKEIVAKGGPCPLSITADLYEPSASTMIANRVHAHYGQVDIVVNNAGGSRPIDAGTSESVWDDAHMLNFTAVRKLTEQFLPGMKERRFGRVFTIGGQPEPEGVNATGVSKAATVTWVKGLSREVGRYGITVNAISPGKIHSEQIDRAYPPHVRAVWEKRIPVGYFGDPQDLATLVVFLSSPLARYITGQRISVDGGLRASI